MVRIYICSLYIHHFQKIFQLFLHALSIILQTWLIILSVDFALNLSCADPEGEGDRGSGPP